MSERRSAASGGQRVETRARRVIRAWGASPGERRLAALAAIGLSLSLFLPWYQETVIANGSRTLQSASATLTGWGAFSFVEAAVLLVAIGVLGLLFQRAEGRAFHLPGGDGWVIMAAGLWTCMLVVWRIFDKQGGTVHGQYATTYGIEWGIFVALGVAAFLAYAGSRIRAAHRPEPPLPGEDHEPPARPRSPQRRDSRVRSPRPVRAEGRSASVRRHDAPTWIGDEDSTVRIRRTKPVGWQTDGDPTLPLTGHSPEDPTIRIEDEDPTIRIEDEDP